MVRFQNSISSSYRPMMVLQAKLYHETDAMVSGIPLLIQQIVKLTMFNAQRIASSTVILQNLLNFNERTLNSMSNN